ncbi:chemotaxis protein CheB [Thiorhodovibrio frisius]|uniref:histidine kinase n=1 Tax=Thiorhodovibrio frisius TaxID=631362 RepID=H8Z8R4_9GAMM|nr:chemotaxis protein CheB [Thiorhodovibrio frisius]EIC19469.1 PAS domain S-box [Thiorhodovibrio frisius]WPL22224.1 Autoinducer 2 sensor kinase/phosphatase LuxQ [Thiorhodovibrio frisius]
MTTKQNSFSSPDTPSDGEPQPSESREDSFPIVGIGASAGGLEALEKFLDHLDANPGIAIVLVTHLDPNRKSLMSELLARHTQMAVHVVEDDQEVCVNAIHVLPPNRDMIIKDGRLQLMAPVAVRGVRHPIDSFLRSLAEDRREDAVAIILSGTGSDGTQGLREIKGLGGMTIVQEPTSAKYEGMPRSALATGLVDLALPIEAIPASLLDYARGVKNLANHLNDTSASEDTSLQHKSEDPIGGILDLIRERLAFDFTDYKRATIERRIEKRALLKARGSKKDYFELLQGDRDRHELQALLKDLLIGVTSFFRDPEAFALLEHEVMPALLQHKKPGDPVRIWVAGCATGEEAYSVAILVREAMERNKRVDNVQIFATDIDPAAVGFARTGIYPTSIAADITPERLARWFRRKDAGYILVKSVRELILFAPHNLLNDPAFLSLDLVVCRNLLIYLNNDAQDQVIQRFYQSLLPRAHLLLGPSEAASRSTDLFQILDKKWRLFQRSPLEMKPRQWLASSPRFNVPNESNAKPSTLKRESPAAVLDRQLLRRYGHPAVLIDASMNLLYYFGDTSLFLIDPEGEPTSSLIRKARPELRLRLRTAVHQASTSGEPVTLESVAVPGCPDRYAIHVEPLNEPISGGFAAVIFERSAPTALTPSLTDSAPENDTRVLRLEEELQVAGEHLRGTVDELETTNEELQSSNEELLAMNEDLQSSNEELEASREELQALNEELITVNAELNDKVNALEDANSDIENLLTSSNLATLFVDKELKLRRFTPVAKDIFHIMGADLGRPLDHLASRLEDAEPLSVDCAKVLASMEPLERQVATNDGRHYLMRLSPYRSVDESVDGVILTFVDFTDRHKAEMRLEHLVEERTREIRERDALMTSMLQAYPGGWIMVLDDARRCLFAQGRGLAAIGMQPTDAISGSAEPVTLANELPVAIARAFNGETLDCDYALAGQHFILTASPLQNGSDEIDGQGRIILVARNITERKRAEQELAHSAWRLAEAQRIANVGDWELDVRTDKVSWSPELYRIFGLDPNEPLPDYEGNLALYLPEDAAKLDAAVRRAVEHGESYSLEARRVQSDGREIFILARGEPWRDESGTVVRLYGSAHDITALKEAEQKYQLAHQHLLEVLESTTDAFFELDADFRMTYINEKGVRALSCESKEELLGRNLWEIFPQAVDTVFYHEYRQAMRTQVATHFEGYFEHLDNWYEIHACPSPTALSVFFQTITERKRNERQLREITEKALAASHAKSAFLANMSHEIRTPLNGIVGMLDLLKMTDLSAEQDDYAVQATHSAKRLTRLLTDILDLSRVEAGQLELKQESFVLTELLDAILQLFEPAAKQKGLELLIKLDPDAPRCLSGDATRVHQILGNLLGNAIKFTPSGRVSLEALSLGNGRRGELPMLFILKDTGIGLTEDKLDGLFEPFLQVENNFTKQHDGVGLGLSIVKRLVQQMRGSICVGSELGRGTEFVLSLPFACVEDVQVMSAAVEDNEQDCFAGLRVLAVEDEKVNQIVIARLLEKKGCKVATAENGREALEVLRAESYDIVLMDQQMPEMDGIEATKAIRRGDAGERACNIPIIALTAFAMAGDKERLMNAGMDAYAPKPISIEQLRTAIREAIAKRANN